LVRTYTLWSQTGVGTAEVGSTKPGVLQTRGVGVEGARHQSGKRGQPIKWIRDLPGGVSHKIQARHARGGGDGPGRTGYWLFVRSGEVFTYIPTHTDGSGNKLQLRVDPQLNAEAMRFESDADLPVVLVSRQDGVPQALTI
jgi:hypothetical protein